MEMDEDGVDPLLKHFLCDFPTHLRWQRLEWHNKW
jgi:hypothetical protein